MPEFRELYMGTSIQSLQLVAAKNFDEIKKVKKWDALNRLADKLYKLIFSDPLDEEKVYVFLLRFNFIYEHMLRTQEDKKFVQLKFGSEAAKVKVHLDNVAENLRKRYREKEEQEKNDTSSVPVPDSDGTERIFSGDLFVSIEDVMKAVRCKENILLMDTRSKSDYEESRIKEIDCISVPEEIIVSGLSAHGLGKQLPPASLPKWKMRETYALVIMDWDADSQDYTTSKAFRLRNILLEWDYEKNYSEQPVILDGGYIEFLQYYPTYCYNPNVVYNKTNSNLDELLGLEDIDYPSELDPSVAGLSNKSSDTALELAPSITISEKDSRESLLKEEKEVAKKKRKVELELIDAEKEWRQIYKLLEEERNLQEKKKLTDKTSSVQKTINILLEDRNRLDSERTELAKKYLLFAGFKPGEEKVVDDIKEIQEIEKASAESAAILEEMAVERQNILAQARAAKVLATDNKMDIPKAPVVNRGNKPKPGTPKSLKRHIEGTYMPVSDGLTGLVNIRNTCYMNTIIQIFRNIPIIMHFFCSGVYATYITRKPDVLMKETAFLLRNLWSNTYSYLKPERFYNAVCMANGTYALGNHEDCMEFFMLFLSQLMEDCAEDMSAKAMVSPIQKSWYDHLGGRRSIYTDIFYHQLKVVRECVKCKEKSVTFDTECTLMVAVPVVSLFLLQDVLDDYLSDDSYTQNYVCAKCKSKVKGYKSVCFYPKIIIIHLKRYIQEYDNGHITFRKNNAQVKYGDNVKFGDRYYELSGIAMHSGGMDVGHYTAICKNPLNDNWYEYNDMNVKRVQNINTKSYREKAVAFFCVLNTKLS